MVSTQLHLSKCLLSEFKQDALKVRLELNPTSQRVQLIVHILRVAATTVQLCKPNSPNLLITPFLCCSRQLPMWYKHISSSSACPEAPLIRLERGASDYTTRATYLSRVGHPAQVEIADRSGVATSEGFSTFMRSVIHVSSCSWA